jgi:hypothetical protein
MKSVGTNGTTHFKQGKTLRSNEGYSVETRGDNYLWCKLL